MQNRAYRSSAARLAGSQPSLLPSSWPSARLSAFSGAASAQQTTASSDKIWQSSEGRRVRRPGDPGRYRPRQDRGAEARAGRSARAGRHLYRSGQGARRRQIRHHDHRRQSGAGGGDVPDRQGCRRDPSVDARSRQRLFLSARHRRDARRRAPHGADLRQGVGRMLGARRSRTRTRRWPRWGR